MEVFILLWPDVRECSLSTLRPISGINDRANPLVAPNLDCLSSVGFKMRRHDGEDKCLLINLLSYTYLDKHGGFYSPSPQTLIPKVRRIRTYFSFINYREIK